MAPTVEDAVGQARIEHPLVREAIADVDAANADADTNDLQARVVMRWNLFNGGINRANLQEQVRRASEARYRLHELQREAEEDVRTAWSLNQTQANVITALTRQSQVSDDLLLSYRSQFNVGRRSLLDVLDAQNTRYNVQAQAETARMAKLYAQY